MTETASPSVRVEASGRASPLASGGFQWFVRHAPAPIVFLSTSLAALGEREALDASVSVAAGASATVTAQGPTTLLRTESTVFQRWRLVLEPGAHLTFLPWLTIPLPGCRSVLAVEAVLGEGASLVAWETLAVGRVARGERFVFDELRATWRIVRADTLVLDDRLAVQGSDRAEAAALLGGNTHLGSLYVAGLDEDCLPTSTACGALEREPAAAASRPDPYLLVARTLGDSGERLEQVLWPVVGLARAALGQHPLAPADLARRWFEAL